MPGQDERGAGGAAGAGAASAAHAPAAARRGPGAKSAERRRSIVEAAHAVFAERGYHAGSFQEIADRVGMSQTGLLHYFRTKSDLLLEVLARRDEVSVNRVSAPPGVVEGVLRQAAANESLPGVVELYTVLCAEATTESHPARAYFVNRFGEMRARYAADFRALEAQGRLRAGVDPERAATSLIGLWDGVQLQWLLDPDRVDVVACLRDFLDGLLADPAAEAEAARESAAEAAREAARESASESIGEAAGSPAAPRADPHAHPEATPPATAALRGP